MPKLVAILILSVSAASVGGSRFAQTSNPTVQQALTLFGSNSSSTSQTLIYCPASGCPTATASFSVNSPTTTAGGSMVMVTIDSNPSGSSFVSVDGTPITTPTTFNWNIGDTHTLSAAGPVVSCGNGCQYVFAGWSDGGATAHTITVSSTVTYTVMYDLQFALTMLTSTASGGTTSPPPDQAGETGPWYFAGTQSVPILAAPNSGYVFTGWTGSGTDSYTGTDAAATINMIGPISETANFAPTSSITTATTTTITTLPPNTEQITINSNPSSQGELSVDGVSIDTPQIYNWAIGSTHYLVAQTSAPGLNCADCQYTFLYWWATSSHEHDSNTFTYTVPTWSETVTAYYQLATATGTSTTSVSTTTSTTSASTTTTPSAATQQAAVPDFAVSGSPSLVSLPPNNYVGSVGFTLTLTSASGWAGQVQFAASTLPADITLSNLPQSYQLSSGGTASWTVSVNIGASTPAGSYQLVVTGISGSLVHSAVVTIDVSNPVTAVPEFPQSILGLLAVCVVLVTAVSRRKRR